MGSGGSTVYDDFIFSGYDQNQKDLGDVKFKNQTSLLTQLEQNDEKSSPFYRELQKSIHALSNTQQGFKFNVSKDEQEWLKKVDPDGTKSRLKANRALQEYFYGDGGLNSRTSLSDTDYADWYDFFQLADSINLNPLDITYRQADENGTGTSWGTYDRDARKVYADVIKNTDFDFVNLNDEKWLDYTPAIGEDMTGQGKPVFLSYNENKKSYGKYFEKLVDSQGFIVDDYKEHDLKAYRPRPPTKIFDKKSGKFFYDAYELQRYQYEREKFLTEVNAYDEYKARVAKYEAEQDLGEQRAQKRANLGYVKRDVYNDIVKEDRSLQVGQSELDRWNSRTNRYREILESFKQPVSTTEPGAKNVNDLIGFLQKKITNSSGTEVYNYQLHKDVPGIYLNPSRKGGKFSNNNSQRYIIIEGNPNYNPNQPISDSNQPTMRTDSDTKPDAVNGIVTANVQEQAADVRLKEFWDKSKEIGQLQKSVYDTNEELGADVDLKGDIPIDLNDDQKYYEGAKKIVDIYAKQRDWYDTIGVVEKNESARGGQTYDSTNARTKYGDVFLTKEEKASELLTAQAKAKQKALDDAQARAQAKAQEEATKKEQTLAKQKADAETQAAADKVRAAEKAKTDAETEKAFDDTLNQMNMDDPNYFLKQQQKQIDDIFQLAGRRMTADSLAPIIRQQQQPKLIQARKPIFQPTPASTPVFTVPQPTFKYL